MCTVFTQAEAYQSRAQAHPNVGCTLPMKIWKNSKRTFKYPIKAVKGPGCALPTVRLW